MRLSLAVATDPSPFIVRILRPRPCFDLLVAVGRANECGCLEAPMTNSPYVLFNKTPEQLRRLGARGGKAYGRNQRARRALLPLAPAPLSAASRETTAQAIALLETQFPWLCEVFDYRVEAQQNRPFGRGPRKKLLLL